MGEHPPSHYETKCNQTCFRITLHYLLKMICTLHLYWGIAYSLEILKILTSYLRMKTLPLGCNGELVPI